MRLVVFSKLAPPVGKPAVANQQLDSFLAIDHRSMLHVK
jgi:hypothetical protein